MQTSPFYGLEPVVFTSDDNSADELFSGYAFSDSDLILGAEGLRAHRAEFGSKFTHHEDGCYILSARAGDALEVGTDFKGNCKVFYYRSGECWAVSNSFARLVDEVRAKSWPVTIKPHAVESWGASGRFWDQCWSYGTAVEEISLLPRWGKIRITNSRFDVIEPELRENDVNADAYIEGLNDYLNTWIGRIGTVVASGEIKAQLELTGGKDSRGVLGLFLAARQHFGVDLARGVNVTSSRSPGKGADLAIAKVLAADFHLELNDGAFNNGPATVLSPAGQIDLWKSFAFGSYRPIYLANRKRYLSTIPFGGQGGEGTRQQYEPYESLESLLEANRRFFSTRDRFDAIASEVADTISRIRTWTPRTPELLAHYQEFRDRFHSGLHPQTRPRFVPLTGRHLHSAARRLPDRLLLEAQALRDLTAQTAPSLLLREYDDPSKAPNELNLMNLASPLPLSPTLGSVYGKPGGETESNQSDGTAWSLVLSQLDTAIERVPEELISKDAIKLARQRAKETPDTAGALTAGPSRPIHHVLLADFLVNG